MPIPFSLAVDPVDPPTLVESLPSGDVIVHFPGVDAELRARPQVVIRVEGAVPAELRERGRSLGASGRYWVLPADADGVLATSIRWASRPGVASALPDLVLPKRTLAFDDPRYESQWYLERLEMERLYARSLGDPSIRVAVIDSAIEIDHPDLAAGIDDPYDAYSDDDDPSPNPGEFCYQGNGICDEHGTAVSGIIGARANNGEGIVGMCPSCTLVPIKMLGEGLGAMSADIAAFEHAIASDVAVINNSWGFIESIPVPDPLADVVRRAVSEPRGGKGAVVVFAAGNDDREIEDDELEAMPEVLCVGATDIYGNPTAYTNFGATLDVASPSATFSTSVEGGYTETFGGTSAAAPVVAGLAAWILSVRPEMTAAEVHALIVDTAVPSPMVTADESGHHDVFGYGIISPTEVEAALFPESDEDETGRACGCGTAGAPTWALAGIAVLAGIRRRRFSRP